MIIEEKASKIFKWSIEQFKISNKINRNPNVLKANIPRYSVYTCHLGEGIGDEKNGHGRPVIVLSSSIALNKSSNVIVAPLSKNIKWKDNAPKKTLRFNYHYVLYKKKYPKLEYDSCIQFEDIRVTSKARLGKYVCNISDIKDINNIQKRIKIIFGL